MLVLSRRRDESIIIGDDIVITIVDIRGDKVRLGIEAPNHVPVHRQEIHDAIMKENKELRAKGARALGLVEGSPQWDNYLKTGKTEIEVDHPSSPPE